MCIESPWICAGVFGFCQSEPMRNTNRGPSPNQRVRPWEGRSAPTIRHAHPSSDTAYSVSPAAVCTTPTCAP